MKRRQPLLIIIGLLLAGCSTSSESEPDPNLPTNIDDSNIPVQVHYDTAEPLRIKVVDLDGIQELHAEYKENGKTIWQETRTNGNSFEKSWRPSAQGPTDATLEISVTDNHEVPEKTERTIPIEILDTRFAEGNFNVNGRFGGTINGYLTVSTPEKKKVSTLEINNGVVNYDRNDHIDADSLQAGHYRNLIEIDGYPETSYPHTDRDFEVVPWEAPDWSYQDVLDHMRTPYQIYEEQGAKRVIERWRTGTEIDVYVYDEQYFDEECNTTGCFVDSEDDNLLASNTYLENSREAYDRLDELIPEITMNIMRQSEKDQAFPQEIKGQRNAIFIAGQPNAPYPITRSNGSDDNAITVAYATQQTNPPARTGRGAGELVDGIENTGPRTTGRESLTMDWNKEEVTPFGENLSDYWYDRPIGTGEYHDLGIPGSDGDVDIVYEYIPN